MSYVSQFEDSTDGFAEAFNVHKPSSSVLSSENGTIHGYQQRIPIVLNEENQIHPSVNVGSTDENGCTTTSGNSSQEEHDLKMKQGKMRRGSKYLTKSNMAKCLWTPEEDSQLLHLVQAYGNKNWSKIGKMIKGRLGKQCRERWWNHLRPGINHKPWTEDEDKILIEAHAELGNKWVRISERLRGRTENNIKNRYNSALRSGQTTRNPNEASAILKDYIKSIANAPSGHVQVQAAERLDLCQDDALLSTYDFLGDLGGSFNFQDEINSELNLSMPSGDESALELEILPLESDATWFGE